MKKRDITFCIGKALSEMFMAGTLFTLYGYAVCLVAERFAEWLQTITAVL